MWLSRFLVYTSYIVILSNCLSEAEIKTEISVVWRWACENESCKKTKFDSTSSDPILSLEACMMFCNEFGLLWPRPTGVTKWDKSLWKLNIQDVKINIKKPGLSDVLMEAAGQRFQDLLKLSLPAGMAPTTTGLSLDVNIVNDNPDVREISLQMDESYTLTVVSTSVDKINATVRGNTFFGVRHGLETLTQVIFYDDILEHLMIVNNVLITDKPTYPYRGILLDTSRNYYTVHSIKRTIDTMAAVKLNTFHWHITDTHSFPFVSERRPSLSKLGAYSPRKVWYDGKFATTAFGLFSQVYTMAAIRAIVQFGLERGVRVLPEFDAPAHVGEGWQDTNLTVCFNAVPWWDYCNEPPCGQLNPARNEVYSYLEDIYKDIAEAFQSDLFHMGGDEVNNRCWKSSEEIRSFMAQNKWPLDGSGSLKLWNYFQKRAQEKAYLAFRKKIPLILWTSALTESENVTEYLNKDEYIIQVWTKNCSHPEIRRLLKMGYRLIISNYDSLYLDCGNSGWTDSGNNWCSYNGWQKIYDFNLAAMGRNQTNQIIGAEAALWSEQVDESTLDSRLWPRAAALAERVWSDPSTTWEKATHRILHLRERFVRMGINAASLMPEWCHQNEACFRSEIMKLMYGQQQLKVPKRKQK